MRRLAALGVMQYEYGPFGEPLRVSGAMAGQNPFQFSTKYTDESGVDFGYRRYDLSTGRWLSRDPIEEQGGINVYGFVSNRQVNEIDIIGMCCLKEIRVAFTSTSSLGNVL